MKAVVCKSWGWLELNQAPQTIAAMGRGEVVGKVVLTVGS